MVSLIVYDIEHSNNKEIIKLLQKTLEEYVSISNQHYLKTDMGIKNYFVKHFWLNLIIKKNSYLMKIN